MWIFFNQGINELKPPVLTTYLRVMWKLADAQKDSLLRKDLVTGKQKEDTLSNHIGKAMEAGLLTRVQRKYEINGEYRSLPNVYTLLNPTHKVWIETFDGISDGISFRLQMLMGRRHSEYILNKYSPYSSLCLQIAAITDDDRKNMNICDSISIGSYTFNIYSQYDPRRITPHFQIGGQDSH